MSIWSGILKGLGVAGSVLGALPTGGATLAALPAWLPAALTGASAVGGALLNTKGARTSTSQSTVGYTEPAEYKSMGDLLRARYTQKLNSTTPLEGYEANGLSNINDVFRGLKLASDNNLTSRGLGTSPVAATADTNLEGARGSQMAQFLNSLPLLQKQLGDQDLQSAADFYARRPLTTTTNSTGVAPGSAVGGAVTSGVTTMAKLLGILHGQGSFGTPAGVKNLPGSIFTGDFGVTPPFAGNLGLG